MTRVRRLLVAVTATALPLGACTTASTSTEVASAPLPEVSETAPGEAKAVIVFIGDGMGISTITAARIYAGQKQGMSGEEYVLPFENFENVALVKTYNVNAQVPDSAGTATAIHSGQKTNMGMLGVGPATSYANCASAKTNPLPLLGEEVKKRGLALGVVSTARITHATPASVYARAPDRDWEADAAMPEDQRGAGCLDIASQLIVSGADVMLGGGTAAFFGADKGGRRLDADADLPADWAQANGGTFVSTADELTAAPMDKPVLGIFSPSHMTYMVDREPDSTEPTLTDMTAQAIKRLGQDEDGYYLMVESGRIDHGHHAGQAGYALEETVEFARAIQYAIDNTDPAETTILVTADHSHVLTIAGYPRRGNDILGLVVPPDGNNEASAEATTAKDGKPYTTLGYANGPGAVSGDRPVPETGVHAHQQSLVPLGSETHAGEDVALYATGPGAQRVRGVIEQDRIYYIIRNAFGW